MVSRQTIAISPADCAPDKAATLPPPCAGESEAKPPNANPVLKLVTVIMSCAPLPVVFITILQDDDYVIFLMKDILGRFGYHIIHALNGDEAVTQFHRHPEIDLVILDTIMPGKNGRKAYNELKEARPDLKAIFTSGYAKSILMEKGIQADSTDFLSKPFSQQNLLKMVREVLDRQQ